MLCGVCGATCQAAPSIVAVIDGVDYSNSFAVTPIAQGFSISASINSELFTFAFDATTKVDPDPIIAYSLSIGGDPTVTMTISQVYLGGPFPSVSGSSNATITDSNLDGHASLIGLPFVNTVTVNGAAVGQYDSGCDLIGAPGFTTTCPVTQFDGAGPNVIDPTVQLTIAFSLSDGDFATLHGSAALSVPEPATGFLMGSGHLAAGFALVRRRADSASCELR
jgi:hypothetical protein